MSILPSANLGSSSSSSSQLPSQNPNSNHGSVFSNHLQLDSLRISDPPPSAVAMLDGLPAPVAPATEDCGESSKKVIEEGKQNGKKISAHQKSGAHIQQSRGATHSAGRKSQTVNGNHLLNFSYLPVQPRGSPALPPSRKVPKRKPYNKDLFLQANYKFVLLDSGNRALESMDPDKMLEWEDIVCVKYLTPHPLHCPICLEELLCPQMTSCGHIFCFPCVLRYFLIGETDNRGECWKKCPLCFMMISSKDLYTIYIENVKQLSVGDIIEFLLLTRQKESQTLTAKRKEGANVEEEAYDSFSKFTFTADVELSVRNAMSELDSWLARAESGLVDDLEKLPYVCAAMEQLEERKRYWKEHRVFGSRSSCKYDSRHAGSPPTSDVGISVNGAIFSRDLSDSAHNKSKFIGSSKLDGIGQHILGETADVIEPYDAQDKSLSSPYDDSKNTQVHFDGFRDKKVKDTYEFYQAADGQLIILHPLNMKCLLHHYGSYDKLPDRISGKILQLETVRQSAEMRKRYRYLSHFSLTTTFQLCEVDLGGLLPSTSLSPFEDELKTREKQRKRIARQEQKAKTKAEAAAAAQHVPIHFDPSQSYNYSPPFSMNDFEALGGSSVTSSSPPTVADRPLFSNVTRLGFAAATDSPALKIDEASTPSGSSTGLKTGGTSFASVISRPNPEEAKVTEVGKKGKKPSRVLLSTSGGRRY